MKYGDKVLKKVEKNIYTTTSSGKKEFYLKFKVNNKSYVINTTEKYQVKNITQARAKLEALKTNYRNGGDGELKVKTVDVYVNGYIETIESKTTYRIYRSVYDRTIKPFIGHKKIHQVSNADIERILESKFYKDKSDRVKLQLKSVLNPVFNKLQKQNIIKSNPLFLVNFKRPSNKDPLTFRIKVEEKELYKVPQFLYKKIMKLDDKKKLFYLFTLMLARRRGEVLQYKISDINGKYLYVRKEITKTKITEKIKLPQEIIELIKKIKPQSNGLLLEYNIDYMSTYFTQNILKDTSLYGKVFTLHDTRHLFVTVMYIQGYESWTLDRCISHTNTGVKGIYLQNSEERRFEIFERYWDILRESSVIKSISQTS